MKFVILRSTLVTCATLGASYRHYKHVKHSISNVWSFWFLDYGQHDKCAAQICTGIYSFKATNNKKVILPSKGWKR